MKGRAGRKVEPIKKQLPNNNRVYIFNISKTTEIFDYLVKERFITYLVGHYIPLAPEIKRKEYYKYYDIWSYSTVNYLAFRSVIQDRINKGILKFPIKLKETI